MPLYEYQCVKCEATLEAIQTFSAPPLEECPECGESSLKKLLSAPAFQFKGSGWYVNDYARKDNANGKSARSSSEAANGNGKASSQGDGASNGKEASSASSSDGGGKSSDSGSSSAKSGSSSAAASS